MTLVNINMGLIMLVLGNRLIVICFLKFKFMLENLTIITGNKYSFVFLEVTGSFC